MPEGVRGAAAAQEVEITRRKFMTESLLMKRERERELKRHQERVQNMKPCVNTKPSLVRSDSFPVRLNRPPVRSRIDKGTTAPSPFSCVSRAHNLLIEFLIPDIAFFFVDSVLKYSVLKLQVQIRRLRNIEIVKIVSGERGCYIFL